MYQKNLHNKIIYIHRSGSFLISTYTEYDHLTLEERKVITVAEIVQILIKAHNEKKNVNLNALKHRVASKYGLANSPKLVDIIAAVPSYTGYEPTSMRAIRARYDPYLQTRHRIEQLKQLGHSVDKVEFIVMGGTFMSLPEDYRDYFIRNLHDALSGHKSSSVEEAVKYSERARSKCIGITIETRPDYCLERHLSDMLRYGCTRLEIGVQSVYEDVALDTNRGHTVKAVCETFKLAKDAGFKVVAHMMPNLPNVDLERDIEQFVVRIFRKSRFRTDGLKIYPTLVIRGTGLYELWKTGRYKSYPPSVLVDLIAKILALVPPWTRVYRVQRDIPMPLLRRRTWKPKRTCLGQNERSRLKCRDIRTREVGIHEIHEKVRPGHTSKVRREYYANGGWETFLSYEDREKDILIGLLRVELKGGVSIIRELHVYGSVVPVDSKDETKFQHRGFGALLMNWAEKIAKKEHGSFKIAVISGVGTRNYYRKMGYELEGPYMVKSLKDGEYEDVFKCLDRRYLKYKLDKPYPNLIKHVNWDIVREQEEKEWFAAYDKKLREKRLAQAAAANAE
nr:unnamed protein product [Callosobruchus analis]